MSDFALAIPHILLHEGGWVNNKNDPGGATNWGVSLRFALASLNKDRDGDGFLDGDFDHDGDIDADDIRKMTREDAITVYHDHFWLPYKYNLIPYQNVANKVFDMCVNMGSKQAHKILQRAINSGQAANLQIGVDGDLGPATLKGLSNWTPDALIKAVCAEHAAFYLNLIAQKPRLIEFKKGWLRRAAWDGK